MLSLFTFLASSSPIPFALFLTLNRYHVFSLFRNFHRSVSIFLSPEFSPAHGQSLFFVQSLPVVPPPLLHYISLFSIALNFFSLFRFLPSQNFDPFFLDHYLLLPPLSEGSDLSRWIAILRQRYEKIGDLIVSVRVDGL